MPHCVTDDTTGDEYIIGTQFVADNAAGINQVTFFDEHIGCTDCGDFEFTRRRTGPWILEPEGTSLVTAGVHSTTDDHTCLDWDVSSPEPGIIEIQTGYGFDGPDVWDVDPIFTCDGLDLTACKGTCIDDYSACEGCQGEQCTYCRAQQDIECCLSEGGDLNDCCEASAPYSWNYKLNDCEPVVSCGDGEWYKKYYPSKDCAWVAKNSDVSLRRSCISICQNRSIRARLRFIKPRDRYAATPMDKTRASPGKLPTP